MPSMLKSLFSNLKSKYQEGGLFNILGGILYGQAGSSLFSKFTGNALTGAEREANAFTASQNELARQFQEDMYLKYQSPAAMMQQYKEAGLNPALMYGGAGSPSQSFSSPSAGSVSPGSGLDLVGSLVNLVKAKAEVGVLKSQEDLNAANASRARAETIRTERLTQAEFDKILSDIDYQKSGISRNEAETALAYANVGLAEIDSRTRNQYNLVSILEKQASSAESEANRKQILQHIENLKRDVALSFVREAEIKANTDVLSKRELQILRENEVLYWNAESSKYEASIKEYENSTKKTDRVFRLIGEGADILKDAGIGIGAAMAGAGRAAGAAAGEFMSTGRKAPYLYGSDGRTPISWLK